MNVRAARIIEDDPKPTSYYQQYMPHNYAVIYGGDGNLYVVGIDVAGWTLDDYVIPRLASGLIVAEEINNERIRHPFFETS
jgi:hypothetical protein